MEIITLFFTALIELSNAMAPYILFGLMFAGVMHELVPDSIVTKHLGKENVSSVVKATVFGIPLPVCSCGVIPLATSIKKSGASKGATLSFLISTPITGIDSILATFGMFGWVFTIYRIITSMFIAIFAGIMTNIFDKEEETIPRFSQTPQGFNLNNAETATASPKFSLQPNQEPKSSCCAGQSSCSTEDKKTKFSLKRAMSYAFGTLLKDIAKPLFLGLVVGALISIAIPQNLSNLIVEYAWISYLITIAIAVPMYVCATASLPIAAALMLNGVSAGAAFVFLSAGPATNTVTIGIVKKMLGTRSLYIYLGSIIFGSVVFGIGLDYIFNINSIDIKSLIHIHKEVGILEIASSIVLWSSMMFFILKPYFKK